MRDAAGRVVTWRRAGRRVAVAVVVGVDGSAPRPLGSAMVVDEDGRVSGSVSAGCVEGAVVTHALEVLGGGPPRTAEFGITDEQAVSVGLTCGGQITVAIYEPTPSDLRALGHVATAVEKKSHAALVTVLTPTPDGRLLALADGVCVGTTGNDELDDAVIVAARSRSTAAARMTIETAEEEVSVLMQAIGPSPRLIISGSSDYAVALAAQGVLLGYSVTVCDARGALLSAERFPAAVETVVQWPHRYLQNTEVDNRTMICVLTHDAKFDVPLLAAALQTEARYIGVLGSRRTQAALLAAVADAGVDAAELSRIRGPIGLDLDARTPAETAVSIAAELIASRGSASARPLRDLAGPIHRAGAAS